MASAIVAPEFPGLPKYVKIMNYPTLVHNGFTYKEGLNVDTLPFDPKGKWHPCGLHFTTVGNVYKYLNHGTLIELIWTITPALILVLIAFPSFKLLYLMDEVTDPSLSVLAEGHQWYWSYEYPDFLNSDGDFVEFDSYLVPESDLEEGALRMLEVDNRVILPEITHTRFILTAADVIHSFAIPALGVKCDAYPGRLNQFSVLINRLGTFYGLNNGQNCSEPRVINHQIDGKALKES